MFSDADRYPYPTLMSLTKLNTREHLTMYGCWLGHSGRTDKENQSSTVLGTLPLVNTKDPDPHQIVGSGSVPK